MRIKILTLLTGLFLFSNLTFAQSVGEYRVRKTETVTRKIEKPKKPKVVRENNPERRGFYVMPEVGIGYDCLFNNPSLNINGVAGYEFNNHIALGAGIGLAYVDGTINLPIFVNVRGDITNKEIANGITPYYSIDFGYSVCTLKDGGYEYNEGMIFTPEFGIKIRNKYYLGIDFLFTTYHNRSRFYDYYYYYEEGNMIISLKFGYKIPLKKVRF